MEESVHFRSSMGYCRCACRAQLGVLHAADRVTLIYGQCSPFQFEIGIHFS